MSEYPYMHVASKMKDFMEKIPSMGTPEKVTYNELAARGFRSTNDRSILSVLKHIKLVDVEGIPTVHWNSYRDRSNNKTLLAMLVRDAYSELFAMYPEAQERADQELRNFVASKTKVGEDTIQRIVSTFKMLCGLADFSTKSFESDASDNRQELPTQDFAQSDSVVVPSIASEQSTIHSAHAVTTPVVVNINIHLPETGDIALADALFRSISRHILGRDMKEDQ